MRKPSRDDYNENENDSDNGDEVITRPPPKKTKKGSDSSSDFNEHTTFNEHHYKLKRENDPTMVGAMALQSLHKSNSSDEGGEHRSSTYSESAAPSKSVTTSKSSGKCTHGSTGSDANTSEDSNKPRAISEEDESEVEYVCVIRPADVSVPSGSSVCFQTYLSTASMVEHDRKGEDTTASGNAQNPRGSPSCSVSSSNDSGSNHSGSDDKQSDNKVSITTGTSSETGSDEGYSA